jgi:uncharacterized protein (TIGR02284 family)
MSVSPGVDILNAMIAVSLDGAGTLAKGADIVKDARVKSLLTELAAERDQVVTRLKEEVRGLGGVPEDRGTVVGSAHRLYTEVKNALAPDDGHGVIEEIQRSEERVREKFQELLQQDKALPPAVREVAELQLEQVRRSCSQVRQLDASEMSRPMTATAARAQGRRETFTETRREEQSSMTGKQRNEGEGNKTAAKQYNEETRKFAQSGKVESQAKAAAAARSGAEKTDLERAEQQGKRKAREEDPQLHRDYAKSD